MNSPFASRPSKLVEDIRLRLADAMAPKPGDPWELHFIEDNDDDMQFLVIQVWLPLIKRDLTVAITKKRDNEVQVGITFRQNGEHDGTFPSLLVTDPTDMLVMTLVDAFIDQSTTLAPSA